MFYHPPIMHDRDSITNEVEQSTASLTFVDVIGAVFTTKDLGEPGNYQSSMPVSISVSLNNTIVSFRVLIDGAPQGSVKHIPVKIKDFQLGYTLTSSLGGSGVPAGSEVQVQYATDKGIVTIIEFSIITDGIPCSRVEE